MLRVDPDALSYKTSKIDLSPILTPASSLAPGEPQTNLMQQVYKLYSHLVLHTLSFTPQDVQDRPLAHPHAGLVPGPGRAANQPHAAGAFTAYTLFTQVCILYSHLVLHNPRRPRPLAYPHSSSLAPGEPQTKLMQQVSLRAYTLPVNYIHRRFMYEGGTSTHAQGTDPREALGASRGAPLNISRCVGGESMPRPYGHVPRRPAAGFQVNPNTPVCVSSQDHFSKAAIGLDSACASLF